MQFLQMFRDLGHWSVPFLVVHALALVTALVCGPLLVFGRRVPPLVPAVALALPVVLALVEGVLDADLHPALADADPAQKATLLASAVASAVTMRMFTGLLVVPAGGLLLCAAVAGVLRGPRAFGVPAVCGLIATLEVALGATDVGRGMGPGAMGVTLLTMMAAIPLVMCGVGVRSERNGPEVAVVGVLSFVVLTGTAWAAALGAAQARIFATLAMVAPDQKATLLGQGLAELTPERWFGLAATLLAFTPLLAVAVASRPGSARLALFGAAAFLTLTVAAHALADPFARQAVQIAAIWE